MRDYDTMPSYDFMSGTSLSSPSPLFTLEYIRNFDTMPIYDFMSSKTISSSPFSSQPFLTSSFALPVHNKPQKDKYTHTVVNKYTSELSNSISLWGFHMFV